MDYKERQDRAEYLVKMFRRMGDKPTKVPLRDPATGLERLFTGNEVADEIERMSDFGRSFVAVAGLLFFALDRDPQFFSGP